MLDFKAAIFDLDGTLTDSMGVWEKIDIDFLAKRNLTVPDGYISEICARSFKEAAEYTISLFGLKENVADIITEWNDMAIFEYGHNVTLKANAKEYLLFLKRNGVKLGTATGLPEVLYEPVLKNNGVYELFDAFSSTDEVSRGKEFPDVFLLAAEKLHTAPCDCIAFEDVLAGIKSIKAAGMIAYGMYDKYSAHEKLEIQSVANGYIYDFKEMF